MYMPENTVTCLLTQFLSYGLELFLTRFISPTHTFKVVMTELKGRGVISTRPFTSGEFVVEYAGELISDYDARMREAEYKKDPEVGSYMFFFGHGYFSTFNFQYIMCCFVVLMNHQIGRIFTDNHKKLKLK